MNTEVIHRALKLYGYSNCQLGEPQKGYRNWSCPCTLPNDQLANLIFYKNEPDILPKIHLANEVSNHLAAQGFPTRCTLDPRIIKLEAGGRTRYAALYSWLPGQTIPWEAYTMAHLKLLGKTMSDLHAALQPFEPQALAQPVSNMYSRLCWEMANYFQQSGVQKALAKKLQLDVPQNSITKAQKILTLCQHLLNQQLLHMDLVRSNVLFGVGSFGAPTITGILDFEKAGLGHPALDVARTLAFLLVDCKYKSQDKIRKYFLASGYHKRGRASWRNLTIKVNGRRLDLLEELINIFLLHDFYKFLLHNPYEFLPANEHFVRTRDLLLARSLISKSNMVQ